MMLKISPKLAHLPCIDSNDLQDLQGNLKDLSESDYKRLVNSLTDFGFLFPIYVWYNPADGKPYTLDGNQRLRAIRRLHPAGVDLPYVEVEATDRSDAKKKILLISSQYGKTTKDGFDEFMGEIQGDTFDTFVTETTTFGEFLDMVEVDQPDNADKPGVVPFSKEVDEESNYVVLLFKTKQDWLQFTSLVNLMPAAAPQTDGKVRSTGTGRVLDGPETIDLLRGY